MIARAERFIASMRRSTRRATNRAPSAASAAKKTSDTAIAWTITAPMRARSPRSRPTSRRKPPGSAKMRARARRPDVDSSTVS